MDRQPAATRIGENQFVVSLNGLVGTEPSSIGHRANRLARAARHGLNVPTGVVVPVRALGSIAASDTNAASATTAALDEIFDDLGHGGQIPLAVSVSALSDHPVASAPTPDTSGLDTRAALLHTARRLSATATLLDESIALVVQHDVHPTRTGTLAVGRVNRGRRKRRAIAELPISRCARRRLSSLCDRTNVAFAGDMAITWGVDAAERVWLLDLRPLAEPDERSGGG